MKPAVKVIIRFAGAALLIASLTCCATLNTTSQTTDAVTDCIQLDWDQCAEANQCRHNRAWTSDANGTAETYVCESKPPVFVAGKTTPTGEKVANR